MKFTKWILIVACFLLPSRPGFADSVLVGTSLTSVTAGAGLCPSDANCENLRQQFTLPGPVVIDQVKVVMSPYLDFFYNGNPNYYGGGDFTVSLSGWSVGSGALPPNPNGDIVPQEFDFGGLGITLGAGTYFLEVTGGNVAWAHGQPLPATVGTLGPEQSCDPTVGCRWQAVDSTLAMEIDGTVVPEPSSWLLFGTGLLGVCGIVRRRLRL